MDRQSRGPQLVFAEDRRELVVRRKPIDTAAEHFAEEQIAFGSEHRTFELKRLVGNLEKLHGLDRRQIRFAHRQRHLALKRLGQVERGQRAAFLLRPGRHGGEHCRAQGNQNHG
ncbi:hypothetical protein OH818_01775 [Jiella pelagia]|uniref:Uncharacterized protein n=1 Tax=Jiella pelagia TaxID=2986949 RepID=A0ABY7C2U8_9HYPH|nr:hypothetical protein OH818_01775 [Jiella pelagia]